MELPDRRSPQAFALGTIAILIVIAVGLTISHFIFN